MVGLGSKGSEEEDGDGGEEENYVERGQEIESPSVALRVG